MQKRTDKLLPKILLIGVVMILVLLPFHAFLTVWLSSFVGNYLTLRLWKEGILMLLLCAVAVVIIRNNDVWRTITQNRYVRILLYLIISYTLLHIVLGAWVFVRDDVAPQAIAYSLISNTRFLLFFIICMIAGMLWRDWFAQKNIKLLLIPASIVVIFGVLQFTTLPVDFLKHFGYGAATIQPYIAVDEKVEYARVQSTTRGPNPLGAYLVVVVSVLVGVVLARRNTVWLAIVYLLTIIVVLYATYSRSAYLGVILAAGVLIFLSIQSAKARKVLAYSGVVGLILLSLGLFALRDNNIVQNVVFHTDEHSTSATSSNESRAGAIQSAASDIATRPLGEGPGSAGPASVYNYDPPKISENYFLQIGQEVGVIGAALFIAISGFVVLALWDIRSRNPLAIALLASFVGICLINMISHAWADDTLAYIWWGFAGIVIGMTAFSERAKKQHEAKTAQTH